MGTVSIIAAMDENRVIGLNNELPWKKIKEDFKWFVKHTKGKPVLMGRKTHESIGRPLPGRVNIVLTKDFSLTNFKTPGAPVYTDESLEHAIYNWSPTGELMVIGGAQVYEAAMPYVNKMYITRIHASFEGDTFFPEYEDKWEVVTREVSGDDNYTYEFQILEPRICDTP